jgi:isoaspartyl peptidase/L-asparaginase-like protein (Ntn-hydrolase superfamily)
MRLIVHGGAGSPPEEPPERQATLDEAAAAGTAATDPTKAVCAALGVLESDPQFNAGVGGAIQSDGHGRTDAGVMTDDREAGAVCGMPGVEHAVDVARIVKTETPHVLVAGVHAVDLAAAFGVETGVDLRTERSRERWERLEAPPDGDMRAHAEWVTERFGAVPGRDHDTVGAVATDGDRVAAATSTGGRWLALAGRVGDVPQVGSGFYCAPAGGASATGAGEDIARFTLSRHAVELLADGYDAAAAAEAAIATFGETLEGPAGLIVMTPEGEAGSAFDSEAMQTSLAGEV